MTSSPAVRSETHGAVRALVLCRPDAYNTITLQLRDELDAAVEAAEADPEVKVILLTAEGPAFCAGYGLDWATAGEATAGRDGHVWDPPQDLALISSFVRVYSKLWYASKPSVAGVTGWCICGGTDLVLWCDVIVAGRSAVFGYPTSRVWGIPTTPMWIYRLGFERAKRYLLTGDEIPAEEAARIGLVAECVPDEELADRAMGLAQRMAALPLNQLRMIKLYCNQAAENMGLTSTRLMGSVFDGVARHTQEGYDFVARAQEVGPRQAVRERDDPFGDYGSGPRSRSGPGRD